MTIYNKYIANKLIIKPKNINIKKCYTIGICDLYFLYYENIKRNRNEK
jgi:hypothetical protein